LKKRKRRWKHQLQLIWLGVPYCDILMWYTMFPLYVRLWNMHASFNPNIMIPLHESCIKRPPVLRDHFLPVPWVVS
jgi:hypothetical protein